MGVNSLSIIIKIVMTILVSVAFARDDPISPRALAMAVIKSAGCTNMVLAHFVMEAAISGVSAPTVLSRVSDVGTFPLTQISKWYALFCYVITSFPLTFVAVTVFLP